MITPATLPWLPPPPADFRARARAAADGATLRALAGFAIDTTQSLGLAKAAQRLDASGIAGLEPLRLGLLSNATTDLIVPALVAAGLRHGLLLEVVAGEYGQLFQQAHDPASAVNRARPDVVLLALDYRGLGLAAGEAEGVSGALAELDGLRAGIKAACGAPTIVQSVAAPPEPLFGSLDWREPGGLRRQVAEFNAGLLQRLAGSTDYCLDVAGLAETVGTASWHDPGQWFLAKLPFAQHLVPLYADHVARLLAAVRGRSRKCLVLDLDNTLWGGVIGDDGLDGIALGNGDAVGEAHLAVQQMALQLSRRGIVLAVCSKNEGETARLPFRSHPDMILREDHIAVFQANWADKASNLEAIASRLDLGLDALVLLDDNPAERAQVRAALPKVAVPEVPADPALFARVLSWAGYFEAVVFSADDRQRAVQYRANAERAQLKETVRDLGDFLASLRMVLSSGPFDGPGRGRIAQLINKSNQFNLTTRRRSEAEVAELAAGSAAFTLQARLVDRFGDNGMIGVAICMPAAEDWEIDTWLMSCRVLGRRVEEAVLSEIAAAARARGVAGLIGRFIPSGRNEMVREHYRKLGFALLGDQPDGSTLWRLDLLGWTPPALPMIIDRVVAVP